MNKAQANRLAARSCQALTLILMLLLLVLSLVSVAFNPLILLFQLIPLALTLPGQFKGSARIYQWLCFVVLFFLIHGILLCFTAGGLLIGLVESAVCLLLFIFAIIFIRTARHAG